LYIKKINNPLKDKSKTNYINSADVDWFTTNCFEMFQTFNQKCVRKGIFLLSDFEYKLNGV